MTGDSGANREIAKELDQEYREDMPLLVGVLNGAITFMTDLMRAMRSRSKSISWRCRRMGQQHRAQVSFAS